MKISVSPSVIFITLVFLISGQIRQSLIPFIAALIHELGHILFAYLFEIRIEKMELNLFGAAIKVSPLTCSYIKEALLAAAGPSANILSAVLVFYFAKNILSETILLFFVSSSIVFALINLLPAQSFDGGRILSCILMSIFSLNTVIKIMEWLSLFCIFFLWSISVYFILKTGSYLSLFIFSGSLFFRIYTLYGKK